MRIEAGYESMATRATEWGTERVLLLGDTGDRVFVVVHGPRIEPSGTVLICSSLFTDTVLHYRREVELSRLLAARGFVVGRFHYRGTGQSEGNPLESTYSTMLADAFLVMEHLAEIGPPATPGFVGTRWGALVAGGLAATSESSPIAVWDPVLAGGSFFTEALQASGVAAMTAGNRGLSPKRSLESTGVANILGFPLARGLYESGQQISLVEQIGTTARELLYVSSGKNGSFSKSHTQAVEQLRASGHGVTAEGVAGPAAWWFLDDLDQTPLDAAETTARWFAQVLDAT